MRKFLHREIFDYNELRFGLFSSWFIYWLPIYIWNASRIARKLGFYSAPDVSSIQLICCTELIPAKHLHIAAIFEALYTSLFLKEVHHPTDRRIDDPDASYFAFRSLIRQFPYF